MKKFVLFGALCMAVLTMTFTSCNSEDGIEVGNDRQPMQVGVTMDGANIAATRARVTNTTLGNNDEIGVFIVKQLDASAYDEQSYNNIKYTATGTGSSQTWSSATNVLLSSTEGKAVAYYPHSTSVSDYANIPVSTSAQTDYLYSEWVTGISNAAPTVNFTMKHALSAVAVKLKKGTYTGTGAVSKIAIKSAGFGTTGTLDASTGILSNIKDTGTDIENTETFTMNASGTSKEFIVVPTTTANNVTITVTIDGAKYEATGAMNTAFAQGAIYTFELTLNGMALEVNSVTVDAWTNDATTVGTLEPAA